MVSDIQFGPSSAWSWTYLLVPVLHGLGHTFWSKFCVVLYIPSGPSSSWSRQTFWSQFCVASDIPSGPSSAWSRTYLLVPVLRGLVHTFWSQFCVVSYIPSGPSSAWSRTYLLVPVLRGLDIQIGRAHV